MKSDPFRPPRSSSIITTTDCRWSDLLRGTSAVTYVDPAFLSGMTKRSQFPPRAKYLHRCFRPPRVFDASLSIINGQILTSTSSPSPHNLILSLSARLVVRANPPNEPSNASRTRSDSPHRNSVPGVNFASYPELNVTVTSMCGLQATLIVSVSLTSWTCFERVSLYGEARLPRYPSPYRYKRRFAGKSSAPQADGLGIGLAVSRPD